jgi:hypothetical protein
MARVAGQDAPLKNPCRFCKQTYSGGTGLYVNEIDYCPGVDVRYAVICGGCGAQGPVVVVLDEPKIDLATVRSKAWAAWNDGIEVRNG